MIRTLSTVILAAVLLVSASAHSQPSGDAAAAPPSYPAAGEAGQGQWDADALRKEGFRPASGPGEGVPGGNLMLAAYALFWVFLLGYVVALARKQRALAIELDGLRKGLEDIDDRLDELGGAPR